MFVCVGLVSAPFCSSLYDAIQESNNGRLAWRYIKPILLGKIPYAPANAATAKIIQEVRTVNSLREKSGTLTHFNDKYVNL